MLSTVGLWWGYGGATVRIRCGYGADTVRIRGIQVPAAERFTPYLSAIRVRSYVGLITTKKVRTYGLTSFRSAPDRNHVSPAAVPAHVARLATNQKAETLVRSEKTCISEGESPSSLEARLPEFETKAKNG